MISPAHLSVLTRESIQDAIRRRIVFAVIVVLLLSLMMLDTCTSNCSGQLDVQGDLARSMDVLAYAGLGVFCVLTTWILTLAGLLAADHLRQTLDDGSALLVLARPVSRATFVVARLLGSLAVSSAAGVILLGGAAFLLAERNDLAMGPAWVAIAACLVNCVTLASLAMAASLHLPRVAIFLLTFLSIGMVSMVNLVTFSGGELGGVYGLVDRFGPPLMTATLAALEPWAPGSLPDSGSFGVGVRLFGWAAFGVAVAVFGFRRQEIRSSF